MYYTKYQKSILCDMVHLAVLYMTHKNYHLVIDKRRVISYIVVKKQVFAL